MTQAAASTAAEKKTMWEAMPHGQQIIGLTFKDASKVTGYSRNEEAQMAYNTLHAVAGALLKRNPALVSLQAQPQLVMTQEGYVAAVLQVYNRSAAEIERDQKVADEALTTAVAEELDREFPAAPKAAAAPKP